MSSETRTEGGGDRGTGEWERIPEFWAALDVLVRESEMVIDRPKGTEHPRYPGFRYELDYGYLKGTSSMDGGGIDLWKGSDESVGLDAILVTVDLFKKDSEIKLLMNCTEEEKQIVYRTHNDSRFQKGVLVRRVSLNVPR